MKKLDTLKAVNSIGIFLLLAGSIAFHVQQGFKDSKDHSPASFGFELSKTIFRQSIAPADTNPFLLLSK